MKIAGSGFRLENNVDSTEVPSSYKFEIRHLAMKCSVLPFPLIMQRRDYM